MYRVTHLLKNLGWVDFHLGCSPQMVGRYCSYLLPKQETNSEEKNCLENYLENCLEIQF